MAAGASDRRFGVHARSGDAGIRLGWLLLAGWFAALALIRSGAIEERDAYWQTRAGVENLAGAPLTRPDTWSWAPVSADFSQTSPGWNVLLGLSWQVMGFLGIFVVSVASISMLLCCLALLSRRLGAGSQATLAGVGVVVLLGMPFLSPRATVAAQAVFLAGVLLADTWRARAHQYPVAVGSAVVAVAATVVTLVGSWIHLSWLLLGPALAACCAVMWLLTPGLPLRHRLCFSTFAAAGVCTGLVMGPHGLDATRLSDRVREACSGLVTEWMGMFTPGLAWRWAGPGLLAIAVSTWALVWAWRRRHVDQRDPRLGLVAALCVLALPAALGGVTAVRFIGVGLLTLGPVIAMAAGHLTRRLRRRMDEPPRGVFQNPRLRFWADGANWRTGLSAALVLLLPGVVAMSLPGGRPLHEQAVAQQLPAGCRVLSDLGSAGAILLVRPDLKVWADSRTDVYGRDRLVEAIRVLRSDSTSSPVFDQADCIVLRRSEEFDVDGLVLALDRDPRWQEVASSGPVLGWVRSDHG